MVKLSSARFAFAIGWALIAVSVARPSAAADPWVSAGFLEFPSSVRLAAVSAVAIDAADRVYVLQRGEPPVVAFSSEGVYERGWGQELFKVPHGLRIDPQGHLWTTDNGNHVLRKFDRQGNLLATLGVVGKPAGGADGFRAPDDLVFDSTGAMYVADSGNSRIAKFDPEARFVKQWGAKGKEPGQFATAHGLAIDQRDHLYVADRGNKRIQVFDRDGRHLADWTGFGNPFGLLVVGGELLASEGDAKKIFQFAIPTSGADESAFASPGAIVASWGDPQQLLLPHFMAVNSKGVLFVAEVDGKRVQMFKRP